MEDKSTAKMTNELILMNLKSIHKRLERTELLIEDLTEEVYGEDDYGILTSTSGRFKLP